MRALGAIVAVLAGGGVAVCVRGAFTARRPRDLAFALAAPALVLACLAGFVIAFSPDAL